MKKIYILVFYVIFQCAYLFAQNISNVTFASLPEIGMEVSFFNTQKYGSPNDNFVRLTNINAGNYNIRIDLYVRNGLNSQRVATLRENISLNASQETNYFINVERVNNFFNNNNFKARLCIANRSQIIPNNNIWGGNNGNWGNNNHNNGWGNNGNAGNWGNNNYGNWGNNTQCNVTNNNPVMSAHDITNLVNTIKGISFDNQRLSTARQAVQRANITARGVRDIIRTFSFESNRLEFAKFAYDYTCDKQNYFVVNEAFSFNTSITNLNQYLQSR
jgi:hypothetical protein